MLKKKHFKKSSSMFVTVGALGLLMLSPIHHNDTLGKYMDSLTGRIEAQAAEADLFSPRWEIDGDGTWHYWLDNGGIATNCWVQDEMNRDWYLLDASGNMLSGVFESYGRYYLLDTVQGTGHYGRLLKNGQEFNGVIIQADTSADYEGALSQETIAALQGTGVSFTDVPGISGTQHVSNGVNVLEEEERRQRAIEEYIEKNGLQETLEQLREDARTRHWNDSPLNG